MKAVTQLLSKDLRDFVTTTYGVGTLLLFVISSFLFLWILPNSSYLTYGYASADLYFQFISYILLIIVPLVTIGSLGKEYRYGTIEFLKSRGVTWRQLVISKLLFTLSIVALLVLLSFIHLWVVDQLSMYKGLDVYQLRASVLGLFLVATIYTVIALAVNSWLEQSTIAILLSILISFFIHSGLAYLSELGIFSYQVSNVVNSLSLAHHIDMLGRGVLRLSSMVYVISLAIVGVGLSIFSLDRKDW